MLMSGYRWIRSKMNLYKIDDNSEHVVTVVNSGKLDEDFYKYACDFYEAAEAVIEHLLGEAAERHEIYKLDLWYFALVYLYRHSLELMLKAGIFRIIRDTGDRKDIIGEIRHNLKQSFEKLIQICNLEIGENENAKWLMEYLTDITQFDEKSDMFRYPSDSEFRTIFWGGGQRNISLIATRSNMNKAYKIIKHLCDARNISEQNYKAYPPKLIIEGGDYYEQSVIAYRYPCKSFLPYFRSYSMTGKFLQSVIIDDGKQNLFMPMCYLYRNAIELGLKQIIIENSHIVYDKALKIVKNKKHSIYSLWNSIEKEVEKYGNAPPGDTTIENTRQYIKDFHNQDPHSAMFRYPCDKNMEPYFVSPIKYDVDNVASCFEELCNFLDAVNGLLGQIRQYEIEAMIGFDYHL